jgi:hypothetical protein
MRMTDLGRGLIVAGVLGGGALVAQACSTLNTTAVQCLSEQECRGKGPGFENTTCDPVSKTCVELDAGGGACKTNQDCITANNNLPAICRKSDNKCVVLQTPECPNVIDTTNQVANDNTIVLGYMGCMNASAFCQQWEDELRLVQSQFNVSESKGIPAPNGAPPRPVIYVSCNEFNVGANGLIAGARHLIDDLQVPIIVGPYENGHTFEIMQQVVAPAGGFAVQPSTQSAQIAGIPSPLAPNPFLYRVSGTEDPLVKLIAASASDGGELQKRAQVYGHPSAADGKWKVLLVQQNSTTGTNYSAGILSNLVINGLTATTGLTTDSAHFRVVSDGNPVVDPVSTPDPVAAGAVAVGAAIGGTTPFYPDIIIYATAGPWEIPYVLLPIEFQWPTDPGSPPPPLHLYTFVGASSSLPPVPPLVSRIFMADVALPPPTPEYETRLTNFFTNYNSFNKTTGQQVLNQQTAFSLHYESYDAYYMASYVLAAIGDQPLTATNAAAAAKKFFTSAGTLVNDDPTDIANTFNLIAQGKPITINGLSGVLSFDPVSAAPPIDAALDCIAIDPLFGPIPLVSGYSFGATTNKPAGAIDPALCPP